MQLKCWSGIFFCLIMHFCRIKDIQSWKQPQESTISNPQQLGRMNDFQFFSKLLFPIPSVPVPCVHQHEFCSYSLTLCYIFVIYLFMQTVFMFPPKSWMKFVKGEKQVSENSLLINNSLFTFILLYGIFIINLKNHHLAIF